MASGAVRHLTTEELAGRLGCDPETVRSLRRHDRGPAYIRIGRGIRYRLVDIEAWELSRLVDPAAQPAPA
jgi:hypothetical protein